jgi:hypothetical protein
MKVVGLTGTVIFKRKIRMHTYGMQEVALVNRNQTARVHILSHHISQIYI